MTTFEWLSVVAYYGQILLIAGGLWQMNRASKQRDRQMDRQDKRMDQRHEETLLALKTLIERTASPSPRQ